MTVINSNSINSFNYELNKAEKTDSVKPIVLTNQERSIFDDRDFASFEYGLDGIDKFYVPNYMAQSKLVTAEDILTINAKLGQLTPKTVADITSSANTNLDNQQNFGSYANYSVNVMVMIMMYLIQKVLPKEIEATDKMQENVLKFLANFNKATQAMAKINSELAKNEKSNAYSAASQILYGAIANAALSVGGGVIEIQGHFASIAKSQIMLENFTGSWTSVKEKLSQVEGVLNGFAPESSLDLSNRSIINNADSINQDNAVNNARINLTQRNSDLTKAKDHTLGILLGDGANKTTVDMLNELKPSQQNIMTRVLGDEVVPLANSVTNIQRLINADNAIKEATDAVDWQSISIITPASSGSTPISIATEETLFNKLKDGRTFYNVTKDATNQKISQIAYIGRVTDRSSNTDYYTFNIIDFDTTTATTTATTRDMTVKAFASYKLDVSPMNKVNFDNLYNTLVVSDNGRFIDSNNLYSYRNKEALAGIEVFYSLGNEKHYGSKNGLIELKNGLLFAELNSAKQSQQGYYAEYTQHGGRGTSNSVTKANDKSKDGYQLLRLAHQDMQYAKEYDQLLFGQKFTGNEGMLQPFISRIDINRQRYDSAIRVRQNINAAMLAGGRSFEGVFGYFSQQDGADSKYEGEMLNLAQTLNNNNLQQTEQLINDLSNKIAQVVSDTMQSMLQAYQTMVQAANLRNGG